VRQSEAPEIKRRPDGSIDIDHYVKIGRRKRAEQARKMVRGLLPEGRSGARFPTNGVLAVSWAGGRNIPSWTTLGAAVFASLRAGRAATVSGCRAEGRPPSRRS